MDRYPLYTESYQTSLRRGETEEWHRSLVENEKCSEDITKRLHLCRTDEEMLEGVRELTEKYGEDRLGWVLANSVLSHMSEVNMETPVRKFSMFERVPAGPGELNAWFASDLRLPLLEKAVLTYLEEMKRKGLLTAEDALFGSEMMSYKGRLLVLRPYSLREPFKSSEYQYIVADSGFGCERGKKGDKIFGSFLEDGESVCVLRRMVYGIADETRLSSRTLEKWEARKRMRQEPVCEQGMEQNSQENT